ncbi:LuxR C-terminal-related transcriptional regulator [Staphylococcus coagulans]|uniref:LuxR C-terminal-related transcriptional regulator n=2 Tax=Staphylococcus coagulans TaxID=74706 RepID=UPI0034E0B9F1
MGDCISMISTEDKKIIEMICLEFTNKQIASKLCYSEAAIEYKLRQLARKLNVQTKIGIVYRYMKGDL